MPVLNRNNRDFAKARSYAEWYKAALAHDKRYRLDQWRETDDSDLYDYHSVKRRIQRLRKFRENGDDQGLLFALNEGIHGNLDGIGNPNLYNKAKSGTKHLIEEYINTVNDCILYLADEATTSISFEEKLDFFDRASHCYGRSAMMFSGGGNLIYFHVGVAKALLEQDLLPSVISGSSAGAIIAAVIGCHTEDTVMDALALVRTDLYHEWEPDLRSKVTGVRPFLKESVLDGLEDFLPDLTFAEAYKLTGRFINISVSPVERLQKSRLLNAITSPNVMIRSAVLASTAVPGLFKPAPLMAKDDKGRIIPYLPKRLWADGSISDDLPAKRLSRLYGVNHYIVSMINILALDYIKLPKTVEFFWKPFGAMGRTALKQALSLSDAIIGRMSTEHSVVRGIGIARSVLSQSYRGDINITLDPDQASIFKVLSPLTSEEIDALTAKGERAAWQKMEQIRVSQKLSFTLLDVLHKYTEHELEIASSYERRIKNRSSSARSVKRKQKLKLVQ